MSQTVKVVWGMDPYIDSPELNEKLKSFFSNLKKHVNVEVTPVHVMSSSLAQMGDYFEPIDLRELRPHIEKDIATYLKNFEGFGMKTPEILENMYGMQSSEILQFSKFIDELNPDMVVLASHGRKGWQRSFLGSFTENFLLRTKKPTVVVGPDNDCGGDFTSALMPIEINKRSEKFVEKFLDDHMLGFIGRLELFHKLSMADYEDLAWAPTLYGSAGYKTEDVIDEAKKRSEEFLKSFLDHPLAQKRLTFNVSDSFESVSSAINDRVKGAGCGLVVLRTHAGPISSRIIGSTAKNIMRESTVPVIVYPYHFDEA